MNAGRIVIHPQSDPGLYRIHCGNGVVRGIIRVRRILMRTNQWQTNRHRRSPAKRHVKTELGEAVQKVC